MAAKEIGKLLLGKCVPCLKPGAAKVAVPRMELDPNLLAYFRKLDYLMAEDPEGRCNNGDIILVEELKVKTSKLLTHKVVRVVYPLGDVVDPITGKPVSGSTFREDLASDSGLYGQSRQAFDYDRAPPRGWQEGRKDFTGKETYIKYHEVEGDDQPYAY